MAPRLALRAVVSQHVESAAFLWLLRDAAVWSPHYTLRDLEQLDERIEAHLDGLRIAEDAGWVTGQTFLVNGGFNTRL